MVLSGECAAPSGRRIGPFRLVDSAVTMAPAALWILGWLHIAQLDGLSSCHYLVLFFCCRSALTRRTENRTGNRRIAIQLLRLHRTTQLELPIFIPTDLADCVNESVEVAGAVLFREGSVLERRRRLPLARLRDVP